MAGLAQRTPPHGGRVSQIRSVQPLKKIKLALQAGTNSAVMDIALPTSEIDFIFGIGSGGLTPFECLLADRREAETVACRVAGSEAGLFFGHLAPLLGRLFENRREVYLNVDIVAVETPRPREVIKAMAELTAHDHEDGCNCGCGGGVH